MFRSAFTLFFLIFIRCLTSQAATFTVISNADSGPGTLRQALLDAAANGSTEKDFIHFNIADQSEAGRTITMKSLMPNVSSNLVIDGTTQTGTAFLYSDARIILTADRASFIAKYNPYVTPFYIYDQKDISIYGFKIEGFTSLGAFSGTFGGVIITNSKNIKIGAPSKGNWILDSDFSICAIENITTSVNFDISVQSNYLGYQAHRLNYVPHGMSLQSQRLTIGGDSPAEGNHIAEEMNIYGTGLKISHNVKDISGNGVENQYVVYPWNVSGVTDLEISYNSCVRLNCYLKSVTNFKIFANTDVDESPLGAIIDLNIYQCTNGVVGSEDWNLRNIFQSNLTGSHFLAPITSLSSTNVRVLKNEIACSSKPYAIFSSSDQNIPQLKILINNDSEYSGTSTPNSEVYVYEDQSGCSVCSPRSFVTKLLTNASGEWKMTGNFAGKRWIANSTLLQSSSEYSTPFIAFMQQYYVAKCRLANKTTEVWRL